MSEAVIRIPSQQSLFNNTNNLVDLLIPGNSGVYDLSQSYVSLLSRVSSVPKATPAFTVGDADNAVYDVRLHMAHQGVNAAGVAATCHYNDSATPIECLVSRCSMISEAKGGVEDIVNSAILRGTMSVYKEDLDSRQAKALTTWAGAAKDQPWVHGQHVQLVGSGDTRSAEVTHEIRLQLRDLFDAGAFEAWDSSVYGQTRIHLELSLKDVILTQVQDETDATWTAAYQQRVTSGTANIDAFGYARSVSQVLNIAAGATSDTFIDMICPYDSLEDVPFWVGQDLTLTPHNSGAQPLAVTIPAQTSATAGEIASGADGDPGRAVIKSIDYDSITKLVRLNFEGVVSETPLPITGKESTLRFDVKGTSVTSSAISYEACELVATMRSDMRMGAAPKEHQYSRFVFQGDQFTNTSGTQRTYQIPANCTAVVIAVTVNGSALHSQLLGSAQVERYRFAIDGESVTNRAITYATDPDATDQTFKGKWGSSLHYDLLQKTFLNMGPPGRYQSMLEGVFSQTIPVGQPGDVTLGGATGTAGFATASDDPLQSAFVIGTPIPMKSDSSQLLLELEGNFQNGASINIWSYVMSTV